MSNDATVYDARRINLAKRLEEKGRGAKTALAAALGVTQSHIGHLLRSPTEASARPVHEDLAKQIEHHLGMAPGELDLPFTRGGVDWPLLRQALRLVVDTAAKLNLPLDADKAVRAARAVYESAAKLGGVESDSTRALVEAILRS